ncbi:MAG: ATP-binding protein [Caulobacteraceae bacterium]|nr:ATP-binding protein [Caulobacteraceae bacterium]
MVKPADRDYAREAFGTAAMACAAFILTILSLVFGSEHGHFAAIWPANAVLVAALTRADARRWIWLMAVGTLAMGCACALRMGPSWMVLALTLCNAGTALIGAYGLRFAAGRNVDLTRTPHLLAFVLLAGLVAPLLSGLPAAWLVQSRDHSTLWINLGEWISAKALGLLLLTPALLAITPASLATLFQRGRIWRALCMFSLLAIALGVVFSQTRVPLLFLIMPVLMLITFQLDLAGGALAVLMTAIVSVTLSRMGLGPANMLNGGLTNRLLLLQLFLAVTSMSVLGAGALLGQQRRLMESLRLTLVEVETARTRAVEDQHWASMVEDIAGIGHWRYEMTSNAITWSRQIYRLFDREPSDGPPDAGTLVANHFPDDCSAVRAHIEATLRDGASCTSELRLRRHDGETRHIMVKSAAERGPDRQVRALFGAVLDITEAKHAEMVLRQSEARYRLLAENVTDVIGQFGLDGEIKFVTPACEALLGYTADEMVGVRVFDLTYPGDWPPVEAAIAQQIAAGPGAAPVFIQYRARHKTGAWVWIEGQPKVIFDENGRAQSIQDVVRDISQRKAAEMELARTREAAEAATTAKTDFLANMSHEIRTPLTGIIGFSGLLEEVEDLPPEARRYVQRIVTGGRTLLSVVNDILDFSKLEAGQLTLDPHPFAPSSFIADTLELVAAQAANKALSLELRVDGDLPGLVDADSSRLRQVLLNLLTNAIKFTARGDVTVEVGYIAASQSLSVAVTDTGEGIPADKVGVLFQRFSQIDGSVSRRHGGTGLGLAICKNLVEMMGGQIAVRSVEDQGSVFAFTIAAPTVAKDMEQASEAPPRDKAGVQSSAHILVVDDLTENRELVRTLLQAIGHTVEEAASGAESVGAALGAPFDLILMDLQMPGMDGVAAAQAIRATCELNRQTPILALSANVLAEQVAACRAAGMDDHIAKPISIEELVTKVGYWTDPERLKADDTSREVA